MLLQPDHMMLLMEGRDRIKPVESKSGPIRAERGSSTHISSNKNESSGARGFKCPVAPRSRFVNASQRCPWAPHPHPHHGASHVPHQCALT